MALRKNFCFSSILLNFGILTVLFLVFFQTNISGVLLILHRRDNLHPSLGTHILTTTHALKIAHLLYVTQSSFLYHQMYLNVFCHDMLFLFAMNDKRNVGAV
jgi:hypothetical protein